MMVATDTNLTCRHCGAPVAWDDPKEATRQPSYREMADNQGRFSHPATCPGCGALYRLWDGDGPGRPAVWQESVGGVYETIRAPLAAALTTGQAAAELGVTDSRVRQLIGDGRLPARKAGRDLLIDPADLELVRDRPTGRPRKDGH